MYTMCKLDELIEDIPLFVLIYAWVYWHSRTK